ncbi:MAG: SDR family oxidoreductase [Pseudomonadota bacterium]
MGFKGKTAVVTGGAGGMGLAIARDLLAEEVQVTLLDLQEPPDGVPSGATFLKGDVTDEAFVADAMAQAFEPVERLDYLVNAAGVLWFGRDMSLVKVERNIWDQVLNINLNSMMLCCRHAVPLMLKTSSGKPESSGAMVHISSIQALRGDDLPQDAYQASKAAMIALSKSLAIQYASAGIRSNSLLPAGTLSPMQQRWTDDPAKLKAANKAIPLGRVGTAQDMADATLFLLSTKASFITGTELIVDGGVTALP